MKRFIIIVFALVLLCLTACSAQKDNKNFSGPEKITIKEQTQAMTKIEMTELILEIEGREISVEWEDNESVKALKQLAKEKPVIIEMSMYSDFEQVGTIGSSLPRNDVQMTTQAGDIVLYQGNQIVIFYGSNSWSYTKLGRIKNLSQEELTKLLGNGDVGIILSII